MLGPVLEQVVLETKGKVLLAKANTEVHPSLGQRYNIRGIPAVKLFHQGKVVGEFVGALSGGQIRTFLEHHIPSAADLLVAEAKLMLSSDRSGAREKLRAAVEVEPAHAGAHLMLARLAFEDGDPGTVEGHVDAIDPASDEHEAAQYLRAALGFFDECGRGGGEADARAKWTANAADLDAGYSLGCCLAVHERWEEALQTLLEVVKRNNKYRDSAAQKAMVTIFGIVGRNSELCDHYVRQLQIYT
jgi:putative thioredoxin